MDRKFSFAKAYQATGITAKLKQHVEDFIVEENIPVEFSGDGEHCWVYIQKSSCNTDWLALQLAKYCGVKQVAVAYAGLKDRHALTSQWFSIQLPGKPTPDWQKFELSFANYVSKQNALKKNNSEQDGSEAECSQEKIKVLKSFRHNRKLQRGALKSNSFNITLRGLSDTSDQAFELLQQRCHLIAKNGVPNYFGQQRFGRNLNNLEQALKLFSNAKHKVSRNKRSIYLSAARSWLFNSILSARVSNETWHRRIAGDVFMLDGKSACFKDEAEDGELVLTEQRLAANQIHPTAALWGEGDPMVSAQALALETEIINQFPEYRDGLVAARLQAQRRSCRVIPEQLRCQRQQDNFTVSFSLPSGSYATMVLVEMFTEILQ